MPRALFLVVLAVVAVRGFREPAAKPNPSAIARRHGDLDCDGKQDVVHARGNASQVVTLFNSGM